MSHACHAPGCQTATPRRLLFCRRCWMLVTPAHRADVNREFAAIGGVAPCRPSLPYLAAVSEARADVMAANGMDPALMRAAAARYRRMGGEE